MYAAEIMDDARLHAAAMYPQESCGLIVAGAYMACRNVHEAPENNFEVHPADQLAAIQAGGFSAVIHSHPDGPAHPSETDMRGQIDSGVPWCILSGREEIWFGDQVPIAPLVGRKFVHGIADCYAQIRDWYRLERKVILKEIPREWEWWKNGKNLYLDNLQAVGFRLVSEDTPYEVGDVLLASILAKVVNHSAIFLGNNLILHHMVNRLSLREPLSNWQKYFTMRARYNG